MKSILVVLLLLVATLSIRIRNKNHLKVKSRLTGKLLLTSRMHTKMLVKFLDMSKMKQINIVYGDIHWNTTEMPDLKPGYPKMVRNFYKFSDRFCYSNEQFLLRKKLGYEKGNKYQVDCLDKDTVRQLAIATALKQEAKMQQSAIYYVNTMRIQQDDDAKTQFRKDFLNQFTFAILPADKDTADEENFNPKIFTVVVPTDPAVDPYTLVNCIFDYSKYKSKDLRDDKAKNCDYTFEAASDYSLKLELTDLHAQYWANKEAQQDEQQ